ncbi:enolase C-terminal domain-like protein [Rhodohalobacter sp. 8-1]|uniref:enolase C-terminal domain-like protein n=1 Tax=Rhodohalobacter sp. 8-1 TaxID=3131972 RepID=UPI0030EE7157
MLDLYRYQLPFKKPFTTGVGTFKYREGLILRYHSSDIDLVSEVAPLPDFSKESLQQAETNLISNKQQIDNFLTRKFTPAELSSWISDQSKYPSVDFGLSSLGLSIISVREQKPLHSILKLIPSSSLKVNAVLGKSNQESFLSHARALITQGFKVLKCKVTANPGHLPNSLKTLAKDHLDISFRLDANRSWPAADISELSSHFRNLPVEYIEEPCPTESIEQFDSVASNCIFPVAADEILAELGLQRVINHFKSDPYLIIKPALHGNLMDLFATLRSRDHLEDKVIFTTALESAIGTRMIATAASMTGSKINAHGLNTRSLFHQNLADENALNDCIFMLQPDYVSWYSFQSINQSFLRPVR